MTQNTQTTHQRLIEMMEKCVDWPDGEGCNGYDFNPAADILAPEIDALTAERDEAFGTIAEVEGAMGMPDGWSSGLEGWAREVIEQNDSSQKSLVARLNEARRELAEARAEIRLLKGQDDFIGDATDRQTFKAARTALERLLIRAREARK